MIIRSLRIIIFSCGENDGHSYLFRNFARTKDRYVQSDSGRYPLYDIICCSGGYGHDSRLLSLVSQGQRYSPQHLSTYTPTPVDGDIPYILGIESSVVYAAVFLVLKQGY